MDLQKIIMEEKIKKLSEPLSIENVDFRVQSISAKGYATILAYKDSRVDMERLDSAVGPLGWKREHTRDNKNCIVSIWDENKKQWISKEDTGTESNTEKEKGLASDSFKRACFNLGIGREVYDYPFVFFQLYPNEFKTKTTGQKTIGTPTYDFKLKKWSWEITFEEKKPKRLIGKDHNGVVRFDSNEDFNGIPKSNTPTPQATPAPAAVAPKKQEKKKKKMSKTVFDSAMKSDKVKVLEQAFEAYEMTTEQSGSITLRIENLKQKG